MSMNMSTDDPKVIVALDFEHSKDADQLVEQLTPQSCRLKVGKEMFTRYGSQYVKKLINKGFDIFLDLKFHDIPNTVAKACLVCADMGVWMINVHAQGGRRMMEAAVNALQGYGAQKPLLIAVTLLTSLEQSMLADIGLTGSCEENVLRLAGLAHQAGIDGVVCSGHEATAVRNLCGKQFCLVTPGIRLLSNTQDDQHRIMTPHQACQLGAHYLVIGRPITQADHPLAVLQKINVDINIK